MILNERGCGFDYEGTRYVIGQTIVGTNASEYEGLYGVITEIRTGDDKETENDTPDLYCSFDPPELPCEIKRLEEVFSDLFGVPKRLDDIILDLVIMAPEMIKPMPELAGDMNSATKYVIAQIDCYGPTEPRYISTLQHEFKGHKEVLGYSTLDHALKWSSPEEAKEKLTNLPDWAKGKHKVVAAAPCGIGWNITYTKDFLYELSRTNYIG